MKTIWHLYTASASKLLRQAMLICSKNRLDAQRNTCRIMQKAFHIHQWYPTVTDHHFLFSDRRIRPQICIDCQYCTVIIVYLRSSHHHPHDQYCSPNITILLLITNGNSITMSIIKITMFIIIRIPRIVIILVSIIINSMNHYHKTTFKKNT